MPMLLVATLIGDPLAATLGEREAATAVQALAAAGASTRAPVWLGHGRACDIPFEGIAPKEAAAVVCRALKGAAVDSVAQNAAGRRKRLLIADMDSTIIGVECIDEVADLAGRRAEVARITERAMRGDIDFVAALRERAAMLAGLSTDALAEAYERRVFLNPGARRLVQTMRAGGAYTALVSGGFAFFSARVAAQAGFHEHQANELEIEDGRLTGRVAEPILGADAKLEALRRLLSGRHLDAADAIAVGDGANDMAMMAAAGLGVAYRAKPRVAEAAGARIDAGDLTALLYLQGYADAEFID